MKRLLSSTTALSLAVFNVQPWPLMAQTLTADGYVVAADGSVLCAPSEGAECNPGDYIDAAMAIESAIAAEAEAAAQAEAEAAAQAEAEAAAQAEAEAAAQAEAEAAAQAEADAAAQAEADAAAQAEADAAAPEQAGAGAPAEDEAAAQALAEAGAELKVEEDGPLADPAAGLRTAEPVVADDVAPIDVPVVSEAEVESLSELLTEPDQIDPTAIEAAAALAETPQTEGEAVALQDIAPAAGAIGSVTEVLTEETTRTSSQEFAAAPRAVGDGKKSGLSDLEKVGLIALGALVVGTIINDIDNERDKRDRRVVSNTGDRVVVLNP